MRVLKKLALAASYVTSLHFLPSPQGTEELAGLARYLPAVGIIIGFMLLLVYLCCRGLEAGAVLASFLVVAAWLGLTGCIHMDGLMDTADGVFSHRSTDKMLEIMRDSRVGNFGAIAGILLIVSKVVALVSLRPVFIIQALLLIPSWARWVEVFVIAFYPYAREEGMGKIWHESTTKTDLLLAAAAPGLLTMGLCCYFHTPYTSLLLLLVILPGILAGHCIYKTLAGHTGDTYGACVELSEAFGLLLFALLQKLVFLQN